MASYSHGSVVSASFPSVTLEAVMKGCARSRKDVKKRQMAHPKEEADGGDGNETPLCEKNTQQQPLGVVVQQEKGKNVPSTLCNSSSPPSTNYWQLKQCLQCGIPFNDHLFDRLAPLPKSLQAAPPRPSVHLPRPPSRALRRTTRITTTRTPNSATAAPARFSSSSSPHLPLHSSSSGRDGKAAERQQGGKRAGSSGSRNSKHHGDRHPHSEGGGEQQQQLLSGGQGSSSLPLLRGGRREKEEEKKILNSNKKRKSPSPYTSCGGVGSCGSSVPGRKGNDVVPTETCPLCLLVRQAHHNFPISLKGEVLKPMKSIAAALASQTSSKANPDGSGGGIRVNAGEEDKRSFPSPTTVDDTNPPGATTTQNSPSEKPPYYHALLKKKYRKYREEQKENEEHKKGEVWQRNSKAIAPPPPLALFLPHWDPERDACSHQFTQDPITSSPSPFYDDQDNNNTAMMRMTTATSTTTRPTSPMKTENKPIHSFPSFLSLPRRNPGDRKAKTAPVVTVASPPSSSLSPLRNPLLLGNPFTRNSISAAAAIANSGGPELRPGSTVGGGGRVGAVQGSGWNLMFPPSNGGTSSPGNPPSFQRSLLHEVLRVQQAAEWLSACPLPTLRVLQQRVLVGLKEHLFQFLGTPWFMLPEKPPRRVQRGKQQNNVKSSSNNESNNSNNVVRKALEEDDEEEEDSEESDEEPILPPPPLTFSSFISKFILIEYKQEVSQVNELLRLQQEQTRRRRKGEESTGSSTSRSHGRRKKWGKVTGGVEQKEESEDWSCSPPPSRSSPSLSPAVEREREREEKEEWKTKKKEKNSPRGTRSGTGSPSSVSQRKKKNRVEGGEEEKGGAFPPPLSSPIPLLPTTTSTTSSAMQKSGSLSYTVLTESPLMAASIHLNSLLQTGRPPPVAPITASNLPYGSQEELLYSSSISLKHHRGRFDFSPSSSRAPHSSSLMQKGRKVPRRGGRGRSRESVHRTTSANSYQNKKKKKKKGRGTKSKSFTSSRSSCTCSSCSSGSSSVHATSAGDAQAGRKKRNGAFSSSPINNSTTRRRRRRNRAANPQPIANTITSLSIEKTVEQMVLSELMHWSSFFNQFFDHAREGHCRDPMFLYAAILLACSSAGRRVLAGGTEAKLSREMARHCLRRPDTHTTHCSACDEIRQAIYYQWRCTLLQYRDVLYTSVSSCPRAMGSGGSGDGGGVDHHHRYSYPYPGHTETPPPVVSKERFHPAPLSPPSAFLLSQEKEEEEACNMSLGVRFFLGTPTVVWWVVCFLQLYRTTSGGTVLNWRKKANEAPDWWPCQDGRKKNKNKRRGTGSTPPPARGGVGGRGGRRSGSGGSAGGRKGEAGFRDTLRPGEVYTICDWITHQADLDDNMFELEQNMGSVLLLPTSPSTNAKSMKVGFSKEKVLASVQKITQWASTQVREGLPLEVQHLLMLLRREFPILAYYSTFFDPPVTCRHYTRFLPIHWVVGKGIVFPDSSPCLSSSRILKKVS